MHNYHIIQMGGWQPIAGSASPNMLMEPGAMLDYPLEAIPQFGECPCVVEQRQAIFEPSRLQFASAYSNAMIAPQDNGVPWDYASPFLYIVPDVNPYPYVLVPVG